MKETFLQQKTNVYQHNLKKNTRQSSSIPLSKQIDMFNYI